MLTMVLVDYKIFVYFFVNLSLGQVTLFNDLSNMYTV